MRGGEGLRRQASVPPGAGTLPRAARARMLAEVMEGLARPRKETSPKYFYDPRGSALFEAITELPEYYLTRTERSLLETFASEWITSLGPSALVELGAGSARKTRLLLDRLPAGALYVPLDVSETFLIESGARLAAEYPRLRIVPHVADLSAPTLSLPAVLPDPALFAFLGSTLGNFPPPEDERLLLGLRARLRPKDALLVGVDLRPGPCKPPARIERAYNDAGGVTAAFNLNVLSVLNRDLGADFDPGAFRHLAFYDEANTRIEMHLVSLAAQSVWIPGGGRIALGEGEHLRTEISAKFDRPNVEALFSRTGLRVVDWRQDPEGLYALVLATPF